MLIADPWRERRRRRKQSDSGCCPTAVVHPSVLSPDDVDLVGRQDSDQELWKVP
jgi:hypothetical protein